MNKENLRIKKRVNIKYNIFDLSDIINPDAEVICIENSLYGIGLQFDNTVFGGHDCNGMGKKGCCLWTCIENII